MSFFSSRRIACPFHPLRNEDGAAALEWAVLASCIAAVAVFGITDLGQTVSKLYTRAVDFVGVFL